VRLFARSGRRLRIAGAGPELQNLRRMAAPNVEFLGRVTDEHLRDLYARCRGLLLCGEEDFGITPVEALASGKPVVALGRGGALETVPAFGGAFYDEPTEEGLAAAIAALEAREASILPAELRSYSERFSEAEFLRKMSEILQSEDKVGDTHSIASTR
jgi:glycosyltransferase involved in cell wall biosynthesis